jgi:sulfur-oxidizing protein SoxX
MDRINVSTLLLAVLGMPAFVLPSTASAGDYRDQALAMVKRDFQAKGSAGLDRLEEDGLQSVCNRTANHPPKEIAARLQQDQFASIRMPADGNLMGDWKAGEKLAQSGRGFTWTDKPGLAVGGNCYNCHRISPSETSFGTVGPSLYQFGKLRGNGPEVQQYVYQKIFNAKAFNVCSEMPRFGHIGALKEAQIRDLVALLLADDSPVNSK